MTQLLIMAAYLVLLLLLGLVSNRFFRGTASDYFIASHSIGPVLLLMSIFGTAMTAFALVGSAGEAYRIGIGVYGALASWSGLVHAGVFYFVGIRLWAIGKRFGFVTQVQFFRDRFESDFLGTLMFPILVGLTVPYLLIGLLSAGGAVRALTVGAFPQSFASTGGAVPPWLTSIVISGVVLGYIFYGGLRSAAWANALQTCVFILTGVAAYWQISEKLGGVAAATEKVLAAHPEKLVRAGQIGQLEFFTYLIIPLSVGMFPHVFQHWLTARSAKAFRLTVVLHPIFILLVWMPCILIGLWATSATLPDGSPVVPPGSPPNTELAQMVSKLTSPVLADVLGAGILAAIMASLDSQFLCLGTMFVYDVVVHRFGEDRFSDRQRVYMARGFILAIVAITYLLSLAEPVQVFTLGVWCFSGFAGLFPLACAAIYWRRATKAGALASVAVTAVTWFYFFRASNFGGNPNFLFYGMLPVTPIFVCSVLALAGVSLFTAAPSGRTLGRYFPAKSAARREALASASAG